MRGRARPRGAPLQGALCAEPGLLARETQGVRMRIGIDLGGTKIEAIALSPAGQEIARRRVDTPRDYAASLEAIATLVQELDRAAGARGTVGVGIPGAVVPGTGLVKNANSTWLNRQPLGPDLER